MSAKVLGSVFPLVVRKDDFVSRGFYLAVFLMFFGVFARSAGPLQVQEDSATQCEDLLSENPQEALTCVSDAMTQTTDTVSLAIIKGQALRRTGEVLSSKLYFQSLLQLSLSDRQRAEINNNLGKVNANLSLYDEAASSFLQALDHMETLGDEEGQAYYLNNIGIVYDLQEDYTNALDYYQRSLSLKKRLGLADALPASYTNIGVTLYNLGEIDSSLHYHLLALKGFEKLEKKSSIARSMNNVGFALIDLKDWQDAERYLTQSLEIRQELGDQRGTAQTRSNLAKLFFARGDFKSAFELSQQSAIEARELGLPDLLRQAWRIQIDVLEEEGQYQSAFSLSKRLDSLQAEIAITERAKKVSEMEAKYQNVKKEKELEQKRLQLAASMAKLDSEVSRRNSLLLLTILLLAVSATVTYGYRQKSRASLLFAAQNILLKKEKAREEQVRLQLAAELDSAKLHLEDKNKILAQVYASENPELPPQFKELSVREKEVLSYLALGWSDKEIGERLFVSVTTVKTHLRRVYSKLLVKGRAEAVSLAHRHGIIGEV